MFNFVSRTTKLQFKRLLCKHPKKLLKPTLKHRPILRPHKGVSKFKIDSICHEIECYKELVQESDVAHMPLVSLVKH